MSGRGSKSNPNKRTRYVGGSSGTVPTQGEDDVQRWKSPLHEQQYRTHTVNRFTAKERAFRLEEGQHPDFYAEIASRGWKIFCELPDASSEDITKEFYANAYKVDDEARKQYISFVRGKTVKYDGTTIHRLLHTTHHETSAQVKCRYRNKKADIEYSGDPVAAAQCVLDAIALPGEEWELTKNNRPRRLKISQLKLPCRLWFYFVVSTIMPSSNHTEVGIWRAVMVWAIFTRKRIDLCRVLADSIWDFAQEASPKGSLGHSSLIQYLCKSARVNIPPPAELNIGVYPEINVDWICKKLNVPPGEALPMEMPAERRVRPRRTAQTMETRMTSLENDVRAIRTEQHLIRHQNQYEYGQFHQYMDYMTSQMAILTTGREDARPRFVPVPYDPTTAETHEEDEEDEEEEEEEVDEDEEEEDGDNEEGDNEDDEDDDEEMDD